MNESTFEVGKTLIPLIVLLGQVEMGALDRFDWLALGAWLRGWLGLRRGCNWDQYRL